MEVVEGVCKVAREESSIRHRSTCWRNSIFLAPRHPVSMIQQHSAKSRGLASSCRALLYLLQPSFRLGEGCVVTVLHLYDLVTNHPSCGGEKKSSGVLQVQRPRQSIYVTWDGLHRKQATPISL